MTASAPTSDEELSPQKDVSNPSELNLGASGALYLTDHELKLSRDLGVAPGTIDEDQDSGCCGSLLPARGELSVESHPVRDR
jgi:hypothetical protein